MQQPRLVWCNLPRPRLWNSPVYDIRVNALCPGYFNTELNQDWFKTDEGQALIQRIPQRRTGELHELDGPLLLLASEAGSLMTGSTITLDGGHVLSDL